MVKSILPLNLTPFIGRKNPINELLSLLKEVRLITLTGAGGVGKTRLSIEVAKAAEPCFAHRIQFVDLSSTFDSKYVPIAIAEALNISANQENSVLDNVISYLQSREQLLVLDNLEQLTTVAPVIIMLLKGCPNLKILATSRVVLNINGEHVYTVPPLELPDSTQLEEVKNYEAIQLLYERAKAIKQSFTIHEGNVKAVAEICNRLEGLPLSIELAAARLKILSPEELLIRLKTQLDFLKGSPHAQKSIHYTLRKTIAWSYNLLNKSGQQFFQALSVFQGGFTVEALEALLHPQMKRQGNPIDSLESLINKSLVYLKEQPFDTTRFYFLEAIRHFSLESLEKEGKLAYYQKKHALYFVAWAEKVAPRLKGKDQLEWLEKIQLEIPNLRAVMQWILDEKEVELGLRLGAALWRFWFIRLFRIEGLQWFNQVLSLKKNLPETPAAAKALEGLGLLHGQLSKPEEGIAYLKKSLALWREFNTASEIAIVLNHISWLSLRLSDYEQAMQLALEAKTIHSRQENQRGIAIAYCNLSWISLMRGAFSEAKQYIVSEKSLYLVVGDLRNYSYALIRQAWIDTLLGNFEFGEKMLLDAIMHLETLKEGQLTAFGKHILGKLHFAQNHYEIAYRLFEQSESLFKETSDKIFLALVYCSKCKAAIKLEKLYDAEHLAELALNILKTKGINTNRISEAYTAKGMVEWAKREYPASAKWFKKAIEHNYEKKENHYLVENLEWLIKYIISLKNYETAVVLMGYCSQLRNNLHSPLPPSASFAHEEDSNILKSNLLPSLFKDCWRKGRQMTIDQAVLMSFAVNDESKRYKAEENPLQFLLKIQEVIDSKIADPQFNTDHLCRAVAMSRTQLHRKLKALTNQSTAHYIRSFRLKKAKALLETTNLPIGEIALQVGFKDFSHFSRTFLKEFGVQPSKIRS